MGCVSSTSHKYPIEAVEVVGNELQLIPHMNVTHKQMAKICKTLVDLELELRTNMIDVNLMDCKAPKLYSLLFDPNTLVISVTGNLLHVCDYLKYNKWCDEKLLKDIK